jgi:hypothetical protein
MLPREVSVVAEPWSYDTTSIVSGRKPATKTKRACGEEAFPTLRPWFSRILHWRRAICAGSYLIAMKEKIYND